MIREGRRADRDTLVALMLALNAEGTAADPTYRLRPGAEAVLREVVGDWFSRFSPFPPCFVAELDQRLVGFVSVAPAPAHPVLDQPPTARIGDLYVAPAHRRQGLARALVGAAVGRARAAGVTRIEVGTLAADRRALAFWRSIGFEDRRVSLTQEVS